jgi:hypothetical protein
MLSTIVLLVVSIAIVVLLTPVVKRVNEPFTDQIETPSCGLVLGGQGEESEAHATDIHSRISRVRLSDPTSRWSQSY